MRSRTREEWEEITATITAEGPIKVSEAARLIPAGARRPYGGKRQHASTCSVVRWIMRGLRGVRLEGCRMTGDTWYTSKQAIIRFQAALSQRDVAGIEAGYKATTPRQQRLRAEREDRELAELLGEA